MDCPNIKLGKLILPINFRALPFKVIILIYLIISIIYLIIFDIFEIYVKLATRAQNYELVCWAHLDMCQL